MKLVIASLFVASAAASRKLEQNGYDEAQEYDETSFLKNYEQVFLKCVPNTKIMSEDGSYDYNAVAYRMCPTGDACTNGKVCSSGGGDYVVGLQTYVQAFFEQFDAENENDGENGDDAFDFGEFGECRELNIEANDDGNANQVQYYIGPACTEDGDIKMALFTDQYCRPDYESEVSMQDLIGIALPYENGGLMDDDECKAYYCWAQNENYEYELNDFCEQLYTNSAYMCEEDMEFVSAVNGQNSAGCEIIKEMIPAAKGSGGAVFLVVILIVAVAGVAGYFVMQKKKTSGTSEGLMM
jgi:hypothetical protein